MTRWPSSARFLLARAAARAERWMLVIRLLALGRVHQNSSEANGLLSYACAMLHGNAASREVLARLLTQDENASAETNLWLAEFARRAGDPHTACRLYRETHARNDWPAKQRHAADALARFTCGYVDGSLLRHIASALARMRLQPGSPLLLTVAGSNTLPLYELWRLQTRKYAPRTCIVLALDAGACAFLEGAGLDDPELRVLDLSRWIAFDSPEHLNRFSRHSLWTLRVLVLNALVAGGHAVVSLDLDAILLSSLDALLTTLPTADILAQKDYSLPMDVARRLGWVVCCGVMGFAPSAATLAFLGRWQERSFREGDDQMAANHLIFESGVRKLQQDSGGTAFQACGASWFMPDPAIVSRSLDSGSVIRHFTRHGETVPQVRTRLGMAL